jgi:hypothetical protein
MFWKLTEGGDVKPCADSRHVGLLVVRSVAGEGRVVISTIFLGLDHAFGSGNPVLFETGVLVRGKTMEILAQYHTFLEALDGHTRYVGELFGTMPHETSYGPIRALAHRVSSDISSAPRNKERV